MALSHNSERLIHPGWSWYNTQKYNMTGKEYHILEQKEHIQSIWFSIANISSRHGEQIVTSSCFCISVILPPQTCVKLKMSVGMLWHIPAKDTIHLKTRKKQFRISSWGKCILLKKNDQWGNLSDLEQFSYVDMFPILTNCPKKHFFGFCKTASTVGKMTDEKIFHIWKNYLMRTFCRFQKNCAQKRNFFGFRKIASLHVSLKNCPMRKFFGIQKIPRLHVLLIFSFFLWYKWG